MNQPEFVNPWKADRNTTAKHYDLVSRNPFAQHVYGSKQWKAIRSRRKHLNPLCQHCEAKGLVRAAQDVDHILPIRTNPELAFDIGNTQSLCRNCHNIKTLKDMRL